jgi:hypothetical protein
MDGRQFDAGYRDLVAMMAERGSRGPSRFFNGQKGIFLSPPDAEVFRLVCFDDRGFGFALLLA